MSIWNKAVTKATVFIGLSFLAFGAQSASSAPTGTFACLINANYSGYVNKTSKISESQSVNALLVFNFSSTTPNTGTLVATVTNNVNNFEKANPTTVTSTSLPYPVNFTLTQITAAQNVFKLVSDTSGDVPYYIAVVNGGNSLLFMSGPSDDKVHNGACQKV